MGTHSIAQIISSVNTFREKPPVWAGNAFHIFHIMYEKMEISPYVLHNLGLELKPFSCFCVRVQENRVLGGGVGSDKKQKASAARKCRGSFCDLTISY